MVKDCCPGDPCPLGGRLSTIIIVLLVECYYLKGLCPPGDKVNALRVYKGH